MKRLGFVVLLLLLVSGCVHTHQADFSVPLPGARAKIGGAERVSLKVSVRDVRIDKGSIGSMRAITSPNDIWVTIPNSSVEDVVGEAVKAEFQAWGFHLAEDGPAFLLVDVQEVKGSGIWYFLRTEVQGVVVLSTQVVNGEGQTLYERNYARRESAVNKVMIGNHDEGKNQLEAVLSAVVRDMCEDDKLIQALFAANRIR